MGSSPQRGADWGTCLCDPTCPTSRGTTPAAGISEHQWPGQLVRKPRSIQVTRQPAREDSARATA